MPNDKTLIFESRFESGNLRKAMKVGPFEYELYLKTIIVLQALRNGTILELKTLEKIKLTDWI